MKRFLFERLPAWLLLAIFLLIVVHAPLTVWLGTVFPAIAVGLKAWKEVLLGVAVILLVIQVISQRQVSRFSRDPFLWLILTYVVIHLMMLGIYPPENTQVAISGLMIDLRYVVFAAAVYVFLRLYPNYRRKFVTVGIIGACIVVGFAALELVLPKSTLSAIGYGDSTIQPYMTVDKNPDFIRFNSTLRGPNPLGAYAIIALAGVVAWTFGKRDQRLSTRQKVVVGAFALASLIALWVSYSRSALIGALIALVILGYAAFGHSLSKRQWLVGLGTILVIGLGIFSIRDTTFFQNVILHDNPTTGASIDSNSAHVASLSEALRDFAVQPLGAGIGSTGSASLFGHHPMIVENQYLMIAREAGWMGLGLFLVIIGFIFYRLVRMQWNWLSLTVLSSGAGLAFVGLLLPVWADDTVSIVWWGLVAVALIGGTYERTTNKKTA